MRPRYSRILVLAVLLVLACAAFLSVACGESDETSTTADVDSAATTAGGDGMGSSSDTTASAAAGESGSVVVKGLVNNPMTITAADLEEMTVVEITVEHPKLGTTDYRGVRFSDLFEEFGVQSEAGRLAMIASDAYMVELSLTDIVWSPDSMIAIGDDGKLNVVIPDLETKSWVKDVVSLEFK